MQLKALVGAKLARWRRVQYSPEGLAKALGDELATWIRSGYPLGFLQKLWRRQGAWPPVARAARL
eukprot:8711393-Alexandrium_andersonii.AAC.1